MKPAHSTVNLYLIAKKKYHKNVFGKFVISFLFFFEGRLHLYHAVIVQTLSSVQLNVAILQFQRTTNTNVEFWNYCGILDLRLIAIWPCEWCLKNHQNIFKISRINSPMLSSKTYWGFHYIFIVINIVASYSDIHFQSTVYRLPKSLQLGPSWAFKIGDQFLSVHSHGLLLNIMPKDCIVFWKFRWGI